jgi:hypothetical protein
MVAPILATDHVISDYCRLFVNRRAFTIQSFSRDPESGRCNYFRPQGNVPLSTEVLRRHLEGEITIALYAINPLTQRCKWMAIDADYPDALRDLLKLQWGLQQEGVEAALERSRRGGHLWIFAQQPLLARACRGYIQALAAQLNVPIMGTIGTSNAKDAVKVCAEGIEIFPKQDRVSTTGYGNALRAPLGIHRASGRRYWFYGSDYRLEAQVAYLNQLKKITEEELNSFLPSEPPKKDSPEVTSTPYRHPSSRYVMRSPFAILQHLASKGRRVGRNYVTRCPACASRGKDRHGDNLSVLIADPRKYKCWAGCTKEEIRSALGFPIPEFRSLVLRSSAETKTNPL